MSSEDYSVQKTNLPYRYASPHPQSDYIVTRHNLLRHLTEASLIKKVSIVRGPAGSGKTTLLSQWRVICREMDCPVIWLTIDQADINLTYFVYGLSDALEYAGHNDAAYGVRKLLNQNDRPIGLARALANLFNSLGERFVLILDQYEHMDSQEIGEMLNSLLMHAIHIRIVLGSRVRPTMPLGNIMARDQLFEIGPSDLNLSHEEIHEIFEDNVPELYTRRLHYETSGEAVAVGFARRFADIHSRSMVSTENWHEHLHEYYRIEVLNTLPEELKKAIAQLVIVERFDKSLASALIGSNAAPLIERLYHIDGLLLRHRGTQDFYFSEMLRRFLEQRLVWLENTEYVDLHRRAVSWFINKGRTAEALRHAVAAQDREKALAILDSVGYANLLAQQGITAAHRLLDEIDVTPDEASAKTLLSLAIIHAHEGDTELALARLEGARGCIDDQKGEVDLSLPDQFVLAEALIAGISDKTLHKDTAPALRRYLENVDTLAEYENRAQAYTFLSYDSFCHGDVKAAKELADKAADEYAETEAVYGSIFMHIHRALACFWLNDLKSALEDAVIAERMTKVFFPDDQRLCALVSILRTGLFFETGRCDPLTDLMSLIGTLGALESWTEVQIWAHLQSARAAMLYGRMNEARGILSFGLEVAERMDAPRLEWNMRLAHIDASLNLGEIDRASQEAEALSITNGEFLQSFSEYHTWQERIGGMLVAIRLAIKKNMVELANNLINQTQELVDQTTVTRFVVELKVAKSKLYQLLDQPDQHEKYYDEAKSMCPSVLPAWLFQGGQVAKWQASIKLFKTKNNASGLANANTEDMEYPDDPLTPRERQILLYIGEGHQNKNAAYHLGLSEATVKFHLRNIYRKLQANNRTQALARYRKITVS
ncbi:helix-turn-helix transcriptional regulator [Kordiimonas pumila]|uniref:LuxR C-terminal-related transcriptional regulator n=1 Tax=Kordiimonas pumila TaxID=2161677 RepID=A0ABV7D8L8_9PROT|nr:LuxR C-terminal-related transcriptional regulator [Kordiimonas pumila]